MLWSAEAVSTIYRPPLHPKCLRSATAVPERVNKALVFCGVSLHPSSKSYLTNCIGQRRKECEDSSWDIGVVGGSVELYKKDSFMILKCVGFGLRKKVDDTKGNPFFIFYDSTGIVACVKLDRNQTTDRFLQRQIEACGINKIKNLRPHSLLATLMTGANGKQTHCKG